MTRRRTLRVCNCTGRCGAHDGSCTTLVPSPRCTRCTQASDHARGTPAQRGYDAAHRIQFREAVLARDPYCTVRAPGCTVISTVADHHPLSRRDLVRAGLNPNDPNHGRGTCHRCHSVETATNQPGGWNARPRPVDDD